MNYLYNLATDKYRGPVAGTVKIFLFALSLLYCLAVKILICLYRLKMRVINCTVISVGNITPGGTGKTLLVEFIADYLRQKGRRVAIISRGYKRPGHKDSRSAGATYEAMGDEPFMLSKNLGDIPVVVDKDRVRGAEFAVKRHGVDTVIFDDGFQQWRIKKDLDIVVIDSTNPFGNGHLLPRGLLRQPLSTLKDAGMFILSKTDLGKEPFNPDFAVGFEENGLSPCQDKACEQKNRNRIRCNTVRMLLRAQRRHGKDLETFYQNPIANSGFKTRDFLAHLNPSAAIFESIHRPVGFYDINNAGELLDGDALKSKTVTLMSAIGDPASFENLIKSLGVNIGLVFRFKDHHNYTENDLERIIVTSKDKNIEAIVTTQKDAVRLEGLLRKDYGLRIFVLRVKLAIIDDEQGFHNRLLKLYSL